MLETQDRIFLRQKGDLIILAFSIDSSGHRKCTLYLFSWSRIIYKTALLVVFFILIGGTNVLLLKCPLSKIECATIRLTSIMSLHESHSININDDLSS